MTQVDFYILEESAPKSRMRVIDGGCLCGHVHEEVAASLLHLLRQNQLEGGALFDRVGKRLGPIRRSYGSGPIKT